MNRIIHLIIAAGLVILVGTIVMYNIEKNVPNTQIKTYLDSLWWCVATVTTVGYGDIVPVSNLGRIVAIFYMFFGISMISLMFFVITNSIYRRRYDKVEIEQRQQQLDQLKNELVSRLSDIEGKQAKCLDLINQMK
ncbi:MAG: two pore domain potassium channel family protein [Thaumarchaeota archaeon]|nr:MAG: two pore domain potassium channel family protein [Nitrososphaerota archaeon]